MTKKKIIEAVTAKIEELPLHSCAVISILAADICPESWKSENR